MKKVFSTLLLGGIVTFYACGPSAEEKAAVEMAKKDSIAAVEKANQDSIAVAKQLQAKTDAEKAIREFPKKEVSPPEVQEKGEIKSVEIGNQVWMSENLNVEHYSNGDEIPNVQDAEQWAGLNTGAWCYYENKTENGVILGKLYNWFALKDSRGLAPKGWHLPSNKDFEKIINHRDNEFVGRELKSEVGWKTFNGTNSSGFNALPGGCRNSEGKFIALHEFVSFWSTEEGDENHNDEAFGWILNNGGGMGDSGDGFGTTYGEKKIIGYYVRCIKHQ